MEDTANKGKVIILVSFFRWNKCIPRYGLFDLSCFDSNLKNLRSCVHLVATKGWGPQPYQGRDQEISNSRLRLYLKWWWCWHQSTIVSQALKMLPKVLCNAKFSLCTTLCDQLFLFVSFFFISQGRWRFEMDRVSLYPKMFIEVIDFCSYFRNFSSPCQMRFVWKSSIET